ncbi:MAG: nuclear transport factor 2 family protein [Candidatus Dormibacteraceae bacterium]
MALVGGNLGTVIRAWVEGFQLGRSASLAAMLDDEVVWQGVLPSDVCNDRGEVLEQWAHLMSHPPRLSRFEVCEIGDQVVVRVDGPDFATDDVDSRPGPRALRFTFVNGRVVHIRSYLTIEEAIAPNVEASR